MSLRLSPRPLPLRPPGFVAHVDHEGHFPGSPWLRFVVWKAISGGQILNFCCEFNRSLETGRVKKVFVNLCVANDTRGRKGFLIKYWCLPCPVKLDGKFSKCPYYVASREVIHTLQVGACFAVVQKESVYERVGTQPSLGFLFGLGFFKMKEEMHLPKKWT